MSDVAKAIPLFWKICLNNCTFLRRYNNTYTLHFIFRKKDFFDSIFHQTCLEDMSNLHFNPPPISWSNVFQKNWHRYLSNWLSKHPFFGAEQQTFVGYCLVFGNVWCIDKTTHLHKNVKIIIINNRQNVVIRKHRE